MIYGWAEVIYELQDSSRICKRYKKLIDNYWKLIVSKEQLTKNISVLFENTENRGLALRSSTFSASFSKVLGKKRLSVLKSIDARLYNDLV